MSVASGAYSFPVPQDLILCDDYVIVMTLRDETVRYSPTERNKSFCEQGFVITFCSPEKPKSKDKGKNPIRQRAKKPLPPDQQIKLDQINAYLQLATAPSKKERRKRRRQQRLVGNYIRCIGNKIETFLQRHIK